MPYKAMTNEEMWRHEMEGIKAGDLCPRCAATKHRGRCDAENRRLFDEGQKEAVLERWVL